MRDETKMTDSCVNREKQELRNKAIHRAKAPKTNQMGPTNRTHPDPSPASSIHHMGGHNNSDLFSDEPDTAKPVIHRRKQKMTKRTTVESKLLQSMR